MSAYWAFGQSEIIRVEIIFLKIGRSTSNPYIGKFLKKRLTADGRGNPANFFGGNMSKRGVELSDGDHRGSEYGR
jgi:hypothetical protein